MGGKTTKEQRHRWLNKPGNRERARERANDYRKTPRGKLLNAHAARKRRANKPIVAILIEWARARAKVKGLEFNLPDDWRQDATCCDWSGLPFIRGDRLRAASIDRIDNSRGYVPDNCRLILRGLNVFKNDSTAEEVETIITALAKHRRLN